MKLIACKKNRIVGIISFLITLLILLSACGKSGGRQSGVRFNTLHFGMFQA